MIKTLCLFCLFWMAAYSTPAAAGTVEGSVRDLSGQALAGATVYASNTVRTSGRRHRTSVLSNSNGSFVLRDLAPGSYEIHAYKESDGYPDTFFAFYGFEGNGKSLQVVDVQQGSTINIVLTLGPKCAKLKLSMRNEEGKPVEGGLTLTRVSAAEATVTLGANSESELLVPPVPFRMEVSAKGYQLWHSGILNPRSGTTFDVTVRLKRSL